ncbi:hypothetical protein BYT27DRAFT_7181417 [Phlegmacium glaucopus]|nr:hypothetical protein BYT27DRAFT_7181417 [Phlegmacium glaucopus]
MMISDNLMQPISIGPNPNIWETHLPPLVTDQDGDNNDELVKSLNILTEVVQILGIPDASYTSYSTAITHLTKESFSLDRSLNRLEQVEDELSNHLASIKHEYHLIEHWNKTLIPGPSNTSSTANMETAPTLERRRETLIKKAKEYHKELESLLVEEPLQVSITVSQLLEQKEKNQVRERELKEKRAKIRAFQGLPPNLELARHELRTARQKQMELVQLRERLLGRMADGVA